MLDPGDAVLQRVKPKSVAVGLLEGNREKLETIRAEALVRMGKLSALEGAGKAAIGKVKGRLLQVSDRYDQAYQRYARVIANAKQEAQNQQEWTDIVVGIAIGVAVGLCFEVGAAMIVVKAGAEAVAKLTEGIEAVGGAATKGPRAVKGTELEPGGLKPEILNMEVWKALTQLHEQAPAIGGASLGQGLLMSNCEYAIGEIKAHASGGSGADQTPDEDVDLVLTLIKASEAAKAMDKVIADAEDKIKALEKSVERELNYSVDQMEKDIWWLWIASIPKSDSDVLDLDEIEDYIGPDGLGLIDFGWWTSEDDEEAAIDKGQAKAAEARNRRNSAAGVGGAGPQLGNL
ncbi:MAG: hypothetical protein LC799_06915 [Actinobacteria bacterium]|nr:hypothetical protein [Actinomycetota bacterium]